MKTKKMVLGALFIAMYVVLSYVSLNLGNMVITFSGLPIIIGAILLGPVSGLEIGLLGSLLHQVLQYGFTLTTVLWILPAGVRGLMVGLYAKRSSNPLSPRQLAFILLLSSLVVTAMNTANMYIDSRLYGYYSWAYVFGALVFRCVSAVLTSLVYLLVLPSLCKVLRKFVQE